MASLAPTPLAAEPAEALVPLPGQRGWRLWPEVALRGAGFPAAWVDRLCDDDLAGAALTAEEDFAGAFGRAVSRMQRSLSQLCAEDLFRRAVVWQNPDMVRNCLDKLVVGERRNARGRYHEVAVATYLQRYALKNDTIGFFGPVGWAALDARQDSCTLSPGLTLTRHDVVRLDNWAIDALADVLAHEHTVWRELRPRRQPSAVVTQGWVVRSPFLPPHQLSSLQRQLWRMCDGERTVSDLCGRPPQPNRLLALQDLQRAGVVEVELRGPMSSAPEAELRHQLAGITSPRVRSGCVDRLDRLTSARDRVAEAAMSTADDLTGALAGFAETFAAVTDTGAQRRAGATYASRTPIYADAQRNVDLTLGASFLELVGAPLELVLTSATWLANRVGQLVSEAAGTMVAASTDSELPLLHVLATVLPEFTSLGADSPLIEQAVAEFQQRWAGVLGWEGVDQEQPHVHYRSADIAAAFDAAFPVSGLLWPSAGVHSPDLMLAANDLADLRTGTDVLAVLGEVHCAVNTLENNLFTDNHPDPSRLVAADRASRHGRRVRFLPRRDSPLVTSRMSWGGVLLDSDDLYVTVGAEAVRPPRGARMYSASELVVGRDAAGATVVRDRDGGVFDFAAFVGEPVGLLMADSFRVFPRRRHQPRLTIDQFVLVRQRWTITTTELDWLDVRDEADRYRACLRWHSAQGIPQRYFLRVSGERKPFAIDLRSLPLVNLLIRELRRAATSAVPQVSVAEMLPAADQLWLTDGHGSAYTAELRCVAVWASGEAS